MLLYLIDLTRYFSNILIYVINFQSVVSLIDAYISLSF